MAPPNLAETLLEEGGASQKPLVPPAPRQTYTLEPSRWVALLLFSLSSLLSAFIWISLAPLSTLASAGFGVGPTDVNLVSLVFMAFYLPASIMSMWLMDRYGLRVNLLTGIALDAACCWVKYGGTLMPNKTAGFWVLLFGQILGSLGQPLILNSPARLAADFFGDSERDWATVTGAMANVVGQLLGCLLPSYLVSSFDELPALMLWQAVPASAIMLLSLFFLKERPSTPPSQSAELQWAARDAAAQAGEEAVALPAAGGIAAAAAATVSAPAAPAKRQMRDSCASFRSLWKDSVLLLRNRNFLWLCGSFSLGIGVSWALLTVQAQIIQPCGYSDDLAGSSAASLLGVGVITSYIAGWVLQRWKAYAGTAKLLVIASLAFSVFALAVNKPDGSALILTSWCLLGSALMPVLPVILELAAEITFPISPDTSSSLLLIGANLVSMFITLGLGPMLEQPISANCASVWTPSAGLVWGCMALGAIMILFVLPDYRRQRAHAQHQEGQQEEPEGPSKLAAAPAATASSGQSSAAAVDASAVTVAVPSAQGSLN